MLTVDSLLHAAEVTTPTSIAVQLCRAADGRHSIILLRIGWMSMVVFAAHGAGQGERG